MVHLSSIEGCLEIKYAWKPQNMKKPRYTSAAMYTVCATAGPSTGSLIEPTKDSWFVLNRCAITDKMTTPHADNTVQNQALPPYYNMNMFFFSSNVQV